MDRAVVYEAEDTGSNPVRGAIFIKSVDFLLVTDKLWFQAFLCGSSSVGRA